MMARAIALAAAATLAGHLVFAQETAETAAGAPAAAKMDDSRDLVYLADDRPVLIRLHVRVDGKSLSEVWNQFVQELFNKLDADGDGDLSGPEARQVPGPDLLLQAIAGKPRPAFAGGSNIDNSPADGKITRQELADYLDRLAGAAPAVYSVAFVGPQGSSDTELFGLLDVNQDGRLSDDELESADLTLRKLDLDDDETLSQSELQPLANPYTFMDQRMAAQTTASSRFLSLSGDASPTPLVRRLLEQYDQEESAAGREPVKDHRLSREELGLAEPLFQHYDADSDGWLDFDELVQFVRKPAPALEVTVRLGNRSQEEPAVQVIQNEKELAAEVRTSPDGRAAVVLGSVQIEMTIVGGGAGQSGYREAYREQLQAADTDNNKYLDRKEVERTFFEPTFDMMDRDSDGKLFEEEVVAYVEQREALARSRVFLTVSDHGRNLFDILDVNRDRGLGRRDFLAAVRRLSFWDADHDGRVAMSEIPHHFRLSFGRGQPSIPALPGGAVDYVTSTVSRTAPANGPLWFRKMDRNQDGDVSRREFLGTGEAFRKLDADSDALIDAAEAAAAK